jgi:poly(3-hydroxybutyrate) depolymerase
VDLNGPIPVVAFLHGGNGSAVDFMSTTFAINDWFEGFGAALNPLPKFIAFAPQGVGIDGQTGGDWNSGYLGRSLRLIGLEDVDFFFDALDQFEQFLIRGYATDIQPVTGGGTITQVFDRSRLMLVGFSNGGQMAYRLAIEARTRAWTVTAVAAFGTSIGGWYREVDRLVLAPNADWTPADAPASLLHVHGNNDASVQPVNDGPSTDTVNSVALQVLNAAVRPDYQRADISGQNSAQAYADSGTATAGWASLGQINQPNIPVNHQNPVWETFDSTGGAVADRQVYFALVGNMAHVVPNWAAGSVAQFFRSWGGL